MIIPNNLVNAGQKMEQEKNGKKKDSTLFFYIRTDLLENKNKIRTIKAEINTKNFLSKFGKQKGSVINKR